MQNENIKYLIIGILVIAAICLAYYFLSPVSSFDAGPVVSSENFTASLMEASNITIFTDLRFTNDSNISHNILQCSVDFASSPYFGSKNVNYISIDPNGCIDPQGNHTISYCFNEASKSDLVIYISPGNTTTYHQKGLLVGVGNNYTLGECGISYSTS